MATSKLNETGLAQVWEKACETFAFKRDAQLEPGISIGDSLSKLDENISNEIDRATNKEDEIESALNSEITRAKNAENTLETNKVPITRTINGKALSSDITLSASDVGADASGSANTALTDAKAYTDTKVADLVGTAPETLDTLEELADALKDNADIVDVLNESIATKANASDLTSHTGNTTVHITSTERTNWNDANSKKHTHSNKTVLDNTTASYTTADKTKLDGIATSAEVNQNAFSNVVVGSTTIAADSKTDSLTLAAGSNVTLTADTTNDKVTIASSHPTITTSTDTTSTATPAHGGTVTMVDSVTRDSNGHVTKVNTKTVTLPTSTATADTLSVLELARSSTDTGYWNPFTWYVPSAWQGSSGIYAISDIENNFNGIFSVKFRTGATVDTFTSAKVHWLAANGAPLTLTLTAETVENTSTTFRLYINAVAYKILRISKIQIIDESKDVRTNYTHSSEIVTSIEGTVQATATEVTVPGYSNTTGTSSTAGLTKLYAGTGTNTDGAMTQNAITTELDGKASKSLYGDTTVNVGRLPETTVGTISFAFGMEVTASGNETHAEGFSTTASGDQSHAEGHMTRASGDQSHAEGNMTRASGESSHAEGYMTTASGESSHAEGNMTRASGESSHAEGYSTTALAYQHAQGHYNDTSLATANGSSGTSTGTAFVIGNGTWSAASNAFRVTGEGVTYAKGAYNTSGADYAEFAEWADGNTDNEDRRGYFVTFDEEKTNMIRKANEGDYILGIVSGNPCIVGNSDESWLGRYVFDEFGSIVYEEIDCEETYVDEETGEEKTRIVKGTFYKQNQDYDPEREYVHRKYRQEWDYVGWLGVLSVRDDNTCIPGGYCKVADGGIATNCERCVDTYRVLERVTDNVIKVALK